MQTGILGYTADVCERSWTLETARTVRSTAPVGTMSEVLARRERSIKVSPRGWKAILHALRD